MVNSDYLGEVLLWKILIQLFYHFAISIFSTIITYVFNKLKEKIENISEELYLKNSNYFTKLFKLLC